MIKKAIPYTDFNGNQRVEEFWFNLTKAELTELGSKMGGGYAEYIETLTRTTKAAEAIKTFKEIIMKAYGRKSPDGRRFEKSPEILADFMATQAFSDLYMELVGNADKAAEFIDGVMGADVQKMMAEDKAKKEAAVVSAAVNAVPAPVLHVTE